MMTLAVFIVCGAIGAISWELVKPIDVDLPSKETRVVSDPRDVKALPLGASNIRPRIVQLVHELETVSGREFRAEAVGMLMPGETLAQDNQFQTLFALTPNAGFTVVPSLHPILQAMAAVESAMLQPTEFGSHVEKDGSRVSGLRVFPGYEAVYQAYQDLLSMPWVLNANKFKNGINLDGGKRFHIVLLGMRPVAAQMLTRLSTALDDAEAKLTTVHPAPKGPSATAPNESAKTTADMFRDDFPQLLKVSNDAKVTVAGKGVFVIPWHVYVDFEGRAKFVGFLIPRGAPIAQIAADMLRSLPEIFRAADANVTTSQELSGLQRQSSKDLKFSGRVVLYHSEALSLRDAADIEDLYKKNDLSVWLKH